MGSSASVYSHSYVAVGLDYTFEFETEPFAEGTCRLAFRGVYRGPGPKNGHLCVTKVFKNEDARLAARNYYPDVRCSVVAQGYAHVYNRLFHPDRPLNFIQPVLAKTEKLAYSIEPARLSVGDYIAVEDFIPGQYLKFNSNTGWCLKGGETVQSFSHFTYHHSKGQHLVCDIQGVRSPDGYTLTDPAIHSRSQEFGATDLGALGMARFFSRHRCNQVCRDWRLPLAPPPSSEAAGDDKVDEAAAGCNVLQLPDGKVRAYQSQLNSDQRTLNSAFRERDDLPAIGGASGVTAAPAAEAAACEDGSDSIVG